MLKDVYEEFSELTKSGKIALYKCIFQLVKNQILLLVRYERRQN